MAELVRSVEIDAAPDAVWSAVTDWGRHGRWMLLTSVQPVSGEGHAAGDRVEARTGVGPLLLRDPMTVTVWRPPYRCEMRHEGPVVRGVGAFDVEALPDGRSRFTWSEWLEPPLGPVGQIGFAATRPLFGAFLEVCLQRLARWAPSQ